MRYKPYSDFPSDMALDEMICSCGRITHNLTIMPGTSPPGICYSCVCKQVTINLPPQPRGPGRDAGAPTFFWG